MVLPSLSALLSVSSRNAGGNVIPIAHANVHALTQHVVLFIREVSADNSLANDLLKAISTILTQTFWEENNHLHIPVGVAKVIILAEQLAKHRILLFRPPLLPRFLRRLPLLSFVLVVKHWNRLLPLGPVHS
jgi:hypothetical protein